MVSKTGRYRLVDFELVQDASAEKLTRTGAVLGTILYVSPEQVARRKVDGRTDIYSLAVTLYEALTLERPFEGRSAQAVENSILVREPTSPRPLANGTRG